MIRSVQGMCLLAVLSGCWRIGEPTSSEAVVSWAAFPDTVVAGETFPFEFAGPITPNACGRLDSAWVAVTDTSVEIAGRRTTFETMCASTPIGFYEVRALALPAGAFVVRAGTEVLGRVVSLGEGAFSPMKAAGAGMVHDTGGCLLFGPGQLGNQRPFALRGDAHILANLSDAIGTRRLVFVRGTLSGFTLCDRFGSRPVIRVAEARLLDMTADDYYSQ